MRLFHPLTFTCGLLLAASQLYAAAPSVVVSADSTSGVLGEPYSYAITTSGDEALSFGHAGTLPPGLSRAGSLISGTPSEPGTFPVTLSASNFDGSGFLAVTFEITAPVPEISSRLEAQIRVGQAFSYTITATNSPTEYLAGGLDQIGGLTLDSDTGIISGTPTNAGNFDVVIAARNGAGLGQTEILNINVAPTLGAGSIQDVTIISPSAGVTLDGKIKDFLVVAEVTPAPGEEIDTVFIEWINPPDDLDSNPREDIIVGAMSLVSTDGTVFTYSGTVDLGFNPDDREVGGGSNIDLRVRAFQTNAEDATDYAEDTVAIDITPIMEFVFPDEGFAMDSIANGDIFASVRLSSNNIDTVTARIAGESILDTVSASSSTLNGIFTFEATKQINFPGLYEVRITALDNNGNTNVIQREITISDRLAKPVAVINTPSPGFTNEVFTAASFQYVETGREPVTVQGVGLVGYDATYQLTLLRGGQGYYPRNFSDTTLLANGTDNNGDNVAVTVGGVNVVNGRVDSLPDTVTTFYELNTPELDFSGSAILDDLSDPGFYGKIIISAQFYRSGAPLREFKIFVNGENVLQGNLDPNLGPVVVPSVAYPAIGSPAPGDYLVVAQVMDQQGEVGTSEPIAFSILPFDPIGITLSRVNNNIVSQGDSVTFDIVPVEPEDYAQIETVAIFDADSDAQLGTAPKVRIDGVDRFRFTQTFLDQGSFGVYAQAVAFNRQSARSGALRVDVQPVNDLRVTLTSPLADQERFVGESITVTGDASSTAGVASVDWLVNNNLVETDTEEPYSLNFTFETAGDYVIRAVATDNFGNTVGSSVESVLDVNIAADPIVTGFGELNVTVLPTDLVVSLTSPTSDQMIVAGESLDFTATASATLGVGAVRWYVNGQVVETDTAPPYALNFEFPNPGTATVFAEAEDSLGARRQSASLQVSVNEPNPLLRDEDFVADIYASLVGVSPTNDQRAAALAALDGSVESRSAFVADLLESNALETTVIVNLIYRTMTGEWPDANALEGGRSVLTNGGAGTLNANALTLDLVDDYEDRFGVLNTQSGVNQLYINKHREEPGAQSEVRLFNSATGGDVLLGTQTIPGYGGDLTSFATQFALDNDLSIYTGVGGLPLSARHLYTVPNDAEARARLAALIAALWGTEPTEAQIRALAGQSLAGAVSQVLTDERYYGQFSTTSVDGFVAARMAALGVFDVSLTGKSADADSDGLSNGAEIALGSAPSDPSDRATTVQSAAVEGTDFVVTYVALKESVAPAGLSIVVECSMTPAGPWMAADEAAANFSPAADQTGLPSDDYERIEFRIDTTADDCTFVRLAVNGVD